VVRYVQMPTGAVDTQLLEDATRRGLFRFTMFDSDVQVLTHPVDCMTEAKESKK
jgi:hypothetical protein